MKDVLVQIIGQYVLFDSASGIGQLDFVWICSAVLLIVCVWSVFRCLGLLFATSSKK